MHLAQYVLQSKFTLNERNALANSIAGFNSEFIEFMLANQSSDMEFDVNNLADELGDMAFYLSAIINTVDFQKSFDEIIDMFMFYWDTVEVHLAGDLLPELCDVNSMFKKIVAHGIDPNANYKSTGNTFNEILLRNLAFIMRVCLDDLNSYLATESQYTLAEIFTLNIDKLQGPNGRHRNGFDGTYNLEQEPQIIEWTILSSEEQEQAYAELDAALTDDDLYISPYVLPDGDRITPDTIINTLSEYGQTEHDKWMACGTAQIEELSERPERPNPEKVYCPGEERLYIHPPGINDYEHFQKIVEESRQMAMHNGVVLLMPSQLKPEMIGCISIDSEDPLTPDGPEVEWCPDGALTKGQILQLIESEFETDFIVDTETFEALRKALNDEIVEEFQNTSDE